VKISVMDPSLPDALRKILPEMQLWKCHQCGQCSSVCPSYQHGGIRIGEIIERASVGALEVSRDPSIWLCMLCQGCTERCQLGANPATVITLIRNIAAASGNLPKHLAEEAKLFLETGLSFPQTGLTKKLRKEMGLKEVEVEDSSLRDLKLIVSRTRLGRLKLE
jgi:heterodisulfide reductase subunit C